MEPGTLGPGMAPKCFARSLEAPTPLNGHGDADDSSFTPSPSPPPQRGARWVEPRLVAEVAFTTWAADHLLRHPSFEGLREDKPAGQVKLIKTAFQATNRHPCELDEGS